MTLHFRVVTNVLMTLNPPTTISPHPTSITTCSQSFKQKPSQIFPIPDPSKTLTPSTFHSECVEN